MSKHKNNVAVLYSASAAVIVVFLVVWRIFLKNVNYYIASAVILALSMLPFFIRFERRKASAREITLTATLIALAVVSRAVFYLVPQVKPIAAVVIVSAVCLGPESGYTVGAFSAFVSNFIFGQGPWTPFQMAALGTVGLISGLLFYKKEAKRIWLAVSGFLLTFVLYGMIVDISTILVMYGNRVTLGAIASVYAAGATFSLVFGISTALFLFLFAKPFIAKITRVIEKYGIIKKD